MAKHLLVGISSVVAIGVAVATTAFAGGPVSLNPNDPDNFTRWANGGENIPFNPDQGGLGFLDSTEAVELTKEAFQVWTDVPTATATYHDEGPLPFDVDETNYGPLYENIFGIPDGLSPIVYDEDGAIFTDLFGSPDFVFGFAGFDALDGNGVPIEGFAFLNGGVLLSELLTVEDMRGVMVHELGHYSGMAHTVTNGQIIVFGDTSGPEPDDRFGPAPTSELETMYPIWVEGAGWASLHADDIAFFSTLYPTADFFASTGTLTGTIYAPNATTPVSGVNVIARNPSNPFADAVSAISGDRGDPGVYTLNGLTPDAEYVVYVDQLFLGRLLPGPEEWHSGDSESNHEEPDTVVSVVAAADETAVGVDIIFESPRPGLPFPLPLGDDGSIELYPPFVFEFCGKSYESVFVNANGFLTFGSPDTGDSARDSPEGLLNGPPRIAPLWRDLNPDSAGEVTYEQTESSFTVSWTGVPTFPDFGSNSFSVTLSRADNHIDMSYAELTPEGLSPGVSGVSCGGGETSGTEPMTDLTSVAPRRLNLKHAPAIYEGFEFGPFSGYSTVDLANSTIGYNGTTGFDDRWSEPNDSFSKARAVHVPFSSADINRYTEIEPAGSDVDYFRFSANAGDVLNVEVTNGRIDSVLCLFAPDGTLIAQNDDSTGLLSQLVVPIPSSGEYRAAVSTWPDLECSAGGSLDPYFGEGRYVLTIGHREPPSCQETCLLESNQLLDDCIASAEDPAVCDWLAVEYRVQCEMEQCGTGTCEGACVIEGAQVFNDCLASGENPALCDALAEDHVLQCVGQCVGCQDQCYLAWQQSFDDCVASGEDPIVCDWLVASVELAQCLEGCGPLDCAGECVVESNQVFNDCFAAGEDLVVCDALAYDDYNQCLLSCG